MKQETSNRACAACQPLGTSHPAQAPASPARKLRHRPWVRPAGSCCSAPWAGFLVQGWGRGGWVPPGTLRALEKYWSELLNGRSCWGIRVTRTRWVFGKFCQSRGGHLADGAPEGSRRDPASSPRPRPRSRLALRCACIS